MLGVYVNWIVLTTCLIGSFGETNVVQFTYENRTYIINRIKDKYLNAQDAANKCQTSHTRLARIESEELNNKLQTYLALGRNGDDRSYWYLVDGSDKRNEGNWTWSNGTEMKSKYWRGRPDYGQEPNGNDRENCITAEQSGWLDVSCENEFPFICEAAVTINVLPAVFKVNSNQGSTITCSGDGPSQPTVSWYFDGKEIDDVTSESSVYQSKNDAHAILNVKDAKIKNEGTYTCSVSNNVDNMEYKINKTMKLRVNITASFQSIVSHSCNSSFTITLKNERAPKIYHRIEVKNKTHLVYSKNTTEHVHVTDLLSSTTFYTVMVIPCPIGKCRSNEAVNQTATTGGLPDKVRNVTVSNVRGRKCKIDWMLPEIISYDFITGYQVTLHSKIVERTLASKELKPNTYFVNVTNASNTQSIISLQPNRKYTIEVQTRTCAGLGEKQSSPAEYTTEKEAPDVIEKPSGLSEIDSEGRVNFTLHIPSQENGPLSCLFVIVRRRKSSAGLEQAYTLDDLMKANLSEAGSNEGDYIAVSLAIPSMNKTLVNISLGDGDSTSCNAFSIRNSRKRRATLEGNNTAFVGRNIKLDEAVDSSMFVVSSTPLSNGSLLLGKSSAILLSKADLNDQNISSVVVPIVVAIAILIVAVIIIIAWKKKKNKPLKDKEPNVMFEDNQTQESTVIYQNARIDRDQKSKSETDIGMPDFEKVYNSKMKNGSEKFMSEFQKLVRQALASMGPTEIASQPELKKLNRYKNILPFDSTRVTIANSETGYINANYIDGHNHRHKFIATQGPLSTTVIDFWMMIAEQKCSVIVMLAKCVEAAKKKCEKYWPDHHVTQTFGPVTVTNVEEVLFCGFVKRTLKVVFKNKGRETEFSVLQFHFTKWPDHGVPPTTSHLARMHKEVMETHQKARGTPMVVHCSAGAGRTGTFIGYDILLEQSKILKKADFFSCVLNMRAQRVDMVQNCDQYIFVHKLVLESHLFGDTDISSGDAVNKLLDIDYKMKFVPTQFKNLARVNPMEISSKQSNEKISPYERMRVKISGSPDDTPTDASFIEAYDESSKLIAAKGPSNASVETFWKMVFQTSVSVIVMLPTDGDSSILQYWPTGIGNSEARNGFNVSLQNEVKMEGFIKRNLKAAGPHKTVEITHLQVTRKLEASKAKHIVKVVDEMQKALTAAALPVALMHCSDGMGITGAFCAIVNLIERLRVENRVDVFRAVKDLRDCKPGMVQNIEQYLLCHEAVIDYVNSFDIYSNFR